MHHVAEEDRAVAARKRVGVGEVLLELAVRVLVVVRVVAPTELVHVVRDPAQKLVVASKALEVVTRLLEIVERVGELDLAVACITDEEVFELHPGHELEPFRARLLELPAEDRPRVVRPLLAVDVDVARKAPERRLPWNGRETAQVGHRRDVGIAR